jgi:hypothetical protein
MDKGNRHKMMSAQPMAPKAAAQAAFINITASTAAFTDLRIFFATGSLMALLKGRNIIMPNKRINHTAYNWLVFV